jgi:methionyl-tRNA formyltransferase
MRIVIITQDDPFYLAKNLDYLFGILDSEHEVVGCIVSSVSPFGKKESFFRKSLKTAKIFGLIFFVRYAIKYIISKFDSNNKVKAVLKNHNIEEIKLSGSINSVASLDKIRAFKPDLLVSIAGNEIFKNDLIQLAPSGCLNLHTALLPKYRGLMPSFWVLKNQERYSGVSVFFVDEGIDSGPILVQETIELDGLSQEELIVKSKKLGMDAISKAIRKIQNNDRLTIENRDEDKTYFGFPTREDVKEFRRVGAKFF